MTSNQRVVRDLRYWCAFLPLRHLGPGKDMQKEWCNEASWAVGLEETRIRQWKIIYRVCLRRPEVFVTNRGHETARVNLISSTQSFLPTSWKYARSRHVPWDRPGQYNMCTYAHSLPSTCGTTWSPPSTTSHSGRPHFVSYRMVSASSFEVTYHKILEEREVLQLLRWCRCGDRIKW